MIYLKEYDLRFVVKKFEFFVIINLCFVNGKINR